MSGECWLRTGVHGDRSCPELRRHVHCRHCPVYTQAALTLLSGELPAGYRDQWTEHVAAAKRIDDGETETIVIFRIGAEWLALPAPVVTEVAELRPVHSLPHRRSGAVLGLANVRGALWVCVSLGALLGLEPSADPEPDSRRRVHRRLLVIRREGVRAACPVDEVHGLYRVPVRNLQPVPATVARATATLSRAVVSWNGQSVGLIDDQRLCSTLQRSLA